MSKSLEEMPFDSGYTHGFKAGREQCQKAAIIKTREHYRDAMFGSSIPTVCRDIADNIAAMEYKEPING